MEGLITLADVPDLQAGDAAPVSEITVARLGKYHDPRYGTFKISREDYDGWARNLSSTFGGRVAIDYDHSPERGKGTEAAAWITGLSLAGDDVRATVEWTPKGARSVRDKAYQFISPTFVPNYKTERGEDRGRALLGAALTNRPVLRELPALSLSREEVDGAATLATRQPHKRKAATRERHRARGMLKALSTDGNTLAAAMLAASDDAGAQLSDSRGRMDLKTLATTLGLDETADQATILAHVAQLPEQDDSTDPKPAPADAPTTLAQPAGKPGKKKGKKGKSKGAALTLSAEETAKLITAANAGQAAAAQLAEQTFTNEWTKTLSEGRVAPAQEDTFRALFAKDPALAVKTLAGLQPIIPTLARGTGENPASGDAQAPAGMDPERYQLHVQATERAKQLARENTDLSQDEAYTLAAIQIEDEHAAAGRGW